MPEVIEPTRLRTRDMFHEAFAGILQRPARTLLTTLGTLLGVGAFTATLGLTATATGQVSKDFTVLAATQVTVKDVGSPGLQATQETINDFPPDADAIAERLNGVVHAGVAWLALAGRQADISNSGKTQDASHFEVDAASPGYLMSMDPTMQSGVLYNTFHDGRHMRVAVLGRAVADQVGISNLTNNPAVFINGVGFTVVGIVSDVKRSPDALLKIFIPEMTATAMYGEPDINSPPSMLIETQLGASALVASQVLAALRPDQPELLQAIAPPDPHQLHDAVTGHLGNLYVLLAVITLVIGAVGIANTTLVAVMERIGEIGLRRSLGARPRHIATQFLAESSALGTFGGLAGTAIGVVITVATALAHDWTAVLSPTTTLPAPLIGTVTGLAAGLYPAIRAARIEPLEALRR